MEVPPSLSSQGTFDGGAGGRMSLLRQRTMTSHGTLKKVCKYGVECYQRKPSHLSEFSHPADRDYLATCRAEGVEPQFVSVMKLFEWCDETDSGKVTREEVGKVWPLLQSLGERVPPLDDRMWNTLDDDGNGHINLAEFAEFTTKSRIRLPLGFDELVGSANTSAELPCGVPDCRCQNFSEGRPKCRYGAECYQKKAEHLAQFAHPGDPDWSTAKTRADREMCICGHKRKLHASGATGVGAVAYPMNWTSDPSTEFNNLVPVSDDVFARCQQLLERTYSDVTTRDRANHNGGDWRVPRCFSLTSAVRNENSKAWRKYTIHKALLQQEVDLLATAGEADYPKFTDVKSTRIWTEFDHDALDDRVNEWYLFHGTSASAAVNICKWDFKMRLAGTNTGTLYGKGTYLAESITKADEYAKNEGGEYTVLICRVLGGNVRYTAERTPDPDELTKSVTEGPYDSILGDRVKVSGTYREFIIFDTENVYPEYILKYSRGDLFKSSTHP